MPEAISVESTNDPRRVLDGAAAHLAAEPVLCNLVASLLRRCVVTGDPGRFWTAARAGEVVGVVFQWPLDFVATVTPMPAAAVTAIVDAVIDAGVTLPGVNGEATTTARFAGHWTERTRSGARPVEGQRLYEVDTVTVPEAPGSARPAGPEDRGLAVAWFDAFAAEIGERGGATEATVGRRLTAGELGVWDDDGVVALAGATTPVADAVRIGPVYTPPECRRRGYASALVAEMSRAARDAGWRCLLYADLANPTSNAIYRAIGYRAVAEIVRYEFAVASSGSRTT